MQNWIKLCVRSLGECCSSQFSCVGNLIKHRKARPETCGLSKYSNKKCAPRASTKDSQILKPQRQRSTKQSAHEPEFLSVEILDDSPYKEETHTTIGSGHLNRAHYSTSSGEEIIFTSENNEFILSNENNDNIPVKRDDDDDNGGYIDNSQQSNKIEIIVDGESGDDYHLTDDIHGENWEFSNTKTE